MFAIAAIVAASSLSLLPKEFPAHYPLISNQELRAASFHLQADPGSLINCTAGGTPCAAGYSAIGAGCCPYENAVCCPNSQTCCPQGSTCDDSGTYGTTCVPNSGTANTTGLSVCKPGPNEPLSTTLPNVLVIGDSVSIGYTPYVAKRMSSIAKVLHSPLDVRDGGAEETAYGLQCLDYFLHNPAGDFLKPDVIMFNFGLHDGPLGNATVPGQAGLPDVYAAQLEEITTNLVAAQPQAKLLFALSSAVLCDPIGDGCVVNLNNQAEEIMAKHNIRTINLHDALVKECGEPPVTECWGIKDCFCPHCGAGGANQGYDWLAETVIVPALTRLLPTNGSQA